MMKKRIFFLVLALALFASMFIGNASAEQAAIINNITLFKQLENAGPSKEPLRDIYQELIH